MSLCAILFIQERLFRLSCILLFCDKPCNNSGYHSRNNSYDCLNQHFNPIYGVFLFLSFLAHLYLTSLQVYNTIWLTICQHFSLRFLKFIGLMQKIRNLATLPDSLTQVGTCSSPQSGQRESNP